MEKKRERKREKEKEKKMHSKELLLAELLLAEMSEVEVITPQKCLRSRKRPINTPTRPKQIIPHPVGDKVAPRRDKKRKRKREIFFSFFPLFSFFLFL